MKKQHIKEIICQGKRGKKNMEKLSRIQKCSILGPQNLGSRGRPEPPRPAWIRACVMTNILVTEFCEFNENILGKLQCTYSLRAAHTCGKNSSTCLITSPYSFLKSSGMWIFPSAQHSCSKIICVIR